MGCDFVETRKKNTKAKKEKKRSNVNIKEVNNGYVVSSYGNNCMNETTMIAKTEKEAKEIASKML